MISGTTKIRLGGEVGRLASRNYGETWLVAWENAGSSDMMLEHFSFEIFVEPLTIPRKTKEELAKKYHDPAIGYEEFSNFIENLEVTND